MKEKKSNKNSKINKIWKYVIVFVIPIICMLLHMVMTSCYPFGENTILVGDANLQYYSFFMELSDKLKNGGSLFFSWDKGMGYDFYSNFFYYLASPFNVIALLFGKAQMELGMAVTMLVQVGMCGVTMMYYFSHTRRNNMPHGRANDGLCILFSLAYSMCDYIVAYQYNIIWLITLILIPVMMLGIERMAEKKDMRLYFVALFFIFVTNFYFAWFACIFAVIWFIDQEKTGIKDFGKKFVHFAITSIVAAMCAAFVLLPCYLSVLGLEDRRAANTEYSITTFGKVSNFIQSFFWGHAIDIQGSSIFTNNNYCGVFVFVLCVVFIFNTNIKKKQRIKRIVEMAVIAVSLNWSVGSYVLHGFAMPNMFSNRYAFIFIILMLVTSFECIANYDNIRLRWLCVTALLIILSVILVFMRNDNVQSVICYMVSILLIAYFLTLFVLTGKKSIKKISLVVNIVVIGLIELVSNFFFINGNAYDVSIDSKGASSEWSDIYEDIRTENMERKTSWVNSENNITYSDTNLFSSSIKSELVRLFDSLGLTYKENGRSYAYKGTTPVTAMMFNVKNVLTDQPAYYGGYAERESFDIYNKAYGAEDKCGIYENQYIEGMGYVVSKDILKWDTDNMNPFVVQNDYIYRISGVEDVFTKVKVSTLDDFKADVRGCKFFKNAVKLEPEEDAGNLYLYQNLHLDETTYAATEYTFKVPYDMDLYVYIQDKWGNMANIYIDGELCGNKSIWTYPGEMLSIGKVAKGQDIDIIVYNDSKILDKGTAIIDFYEFHEDKMQECIAYLSDKKMKTEKISDTYIKASVNAEKDGLLYTSIPYYKGFQVYVDGDKTDITGLANDAFIGVELTAGEHTVELKYIPYGLVIGCILSCAGLCIVIFYVMTAFKKKNK